MTRTVTTVTTVTVLLLGAALLSPATAASPAVGIKEFTYLPAQLRVPVGTKVTWTNRDEEVHTVTSAAGGLRATRTL